MRAHELRRVLRPRPEVFAYASDLANTEAWHPGVLSARPAEPGPPGIGTRYELEVRLAGATFPMVYEITEYEPGYRVAVSGHGDRLRTIDEIKLIDDGDNTVIDYTANVEFRDFLRLLAPVAGPLVRRAGSRSMDALVALLEG